MPYWHWHIFTLTWVRAFKSSGGSLCTLNSLQNTRDIAMDIDIDKMFPKGFSSDLIFRQAHSIYEFREPIWMLTEFREAGTVQAKWVLRPTYSIFGCRKPIWSRGHLLASFVQRPLLEMDNMQKAFQTCEPTVKDPLSNCISSHCILQMQFRIRNVKSCAETRFSFEQVF